MMPIDFPKTQLMRALVVWLEQAPDRKAASTSEMTLGSRPSCLLRRITAIGL